MGLEYVSPDLVSFIFVLDGVFRDSRSVYVCVYLICGDLWFPSLGTLSGFHHFLSAVEELPI